MLMMIEVDRSDAVLHAMKLKTLEDEVVEVKVRVGATPPCLPSLCASGVLAFFALAHPAQLVTRLDWKRGDTTARDGMSVTYTSVAVSKPEAMVGDSFRMRYYYRLMS